MSCRKKLIELGGVLIPRSCGECGLFGGCPHYPHVPEPTQEQQIQSLTTENQALKAEVERLKKALDQAIDRGNIEFAFIVGTRQRMLTAEASGYWAPSRTPQLAQYLKEQK